MPETKEQAAKHTTGDWLIDYAETGVRWPVIYVVDESFADGRHEIAELSDHTARNANARRNTLKKRWVPTPEADEAMANARLIAAAPDLLAACEKALYQLHLHASGGNLTEDDACDACAELEAAIAKAEGR
jgi:hypothetical protein